MSVHRKSTERSKERQTNWGYLFEQGVRLIEVSPRREFTVMQEKCRCINKVEVSYKIEVHVGVTIKHPFSNLNLQWMIVLLLCAIFNTNIMICFCYLSCHSLLLRIKCLTCTCW